MTIADLKAMYDYCGELKTYHAGEMKKYIHDEVEYKYHKAMYWDFQEKYYIASKCLSTAIDDVYNKSKVKAD